MSLRVKIYSIVSHLTWPHPLTHPSTHTHPWVGVSLQIINLQTELNYLDSVNNFQIFSDLTWPHPSTHPSTHPPTHQIIHPPMGGGVSTDFKSSNRIEISRLVQVLLNFEWFLGSPPGGGGWLDGVGDGEGAPHLCAHVCTCTHMYDIIGNSQGFPQWGWPFAWNYHVYHACVWVRACACMHVHVCRCMCTCVGAPPKHYPPHPPTPPTPKSHREPKTPKFNKSWTNWDNSILFEDSLTLNIPELI